MNKKIKIFLVIFFLTMSFFGRGVFAADIEKVEYKEGIVLDSDLDGLTDEGESKLYLTDPQKMDTDSDGYGDGVEVFSETNPIDSSVYPGAQVQNSSLQQNQVQDQKSEIPWAWFVTRASGLVAFLLLYISIFLGLTIRIPIFRKIFSPLYSLKIHCWISLQATLFALVHGSALLFDRAFKFSLVDVFVPFSSKFEPNLVALGILGFYLMIILVMTSYGRKFISQKIWRITHFTNIVLYGAVFAHALYLGTDLKNQSFAWFFVLANAFLVFIMLYNIERRIFDAISRKRNLNENIQKNEIEKQ